MAYRVFYMNPWGDHIFYKRTETKEEADAVCKRMQEETETEFYFMEDTYNNKTPLERVLKEEN